MASSGEDVAVTRIGKMKAKLQKFRYQENGNASSAVDRSADDLEESESLNRSSKKRKRRQKQDNKKGPKKAVYWEDSSDSQTENGINNDEVDDSSPGTSKETAEKSENNYCDDDHDTPINDKFTVSANCFRKKSSRMRLESSSEDGEDNSTTVPREISNDVHRLSPVNLSESDNESKEADADVDGKETKLQRLREMFPRVDSMELQDALVNSDWCLQAAIDSMLVVNSSAANSSDSGSEKNDSDRSSNRAGSSRHGSDSPNRSKRKRLKTGKPQHRSAAGSRKGHRNKSKKSKDLLDSDCTFSAKEILYDSDDSDIDTEMTPAKQAVLTFLDQATDAELAQMPEYSKKKVECIQVLRPFKSWIDLVVKLQHSKGVSTDLLSAAQSLLAAREVVTKLMDRCEQISSKLADSVLRLMSGAEVDDRLTDQPALLNKNLSLTPHQMLGLNWLVLLHKHKVNGILADEMGLGKTIQTIAFLAYLLENGIDGPFAIVVPSSTMDNWQREIRTWAPHINVIAYQGSQQDRSSIRYNILKGTFDRVQVIVSSYQMVIANPEDRALFRRLRFRYAIFDEAHMLKNMTTKRYKHLMGINASHRLLLTGTPLQNSLIELMSLLTFVVPDMFDGKVQHLTKIFSVETKGESGHQSIQFERERVAQAKQIMRPFVLRRMKDEVLKTLPKKHHESVQCPMTNEQSDHYRDLVHTFREQILNKSSARPPRTSCAMQLRKLANHPLLLRYLYNDRQLRKMAREMLQEPTHTDANELLILEDMQAMSDFELHQLCKQYKSIRAYALADDVIASSGKFIALDKLLADIKIKGDRVLIFSQFVMLLDVLELHVRNRGHSYVRFDGSTATSERQQLIDKFSADKGIFLFLLSTKAGGLGVNLTAANVVILHDVGFNPYDEKQAEDRCHRLGQTKEVTVIHLLSKGTIDEHILKLAEKKLKLERDLTATSNDSTSEESEDVATLLKAALSL